MKKTIAVLMVSSLAFMSCMNQQKTNSADAESTKVTVEFVGNSNGEIKNKAGKAILFAVPDQVADVPATEVASVNFETRSLPFTVNFDLPANHKSLIKPEIKDTDRVHYYVSLDWDSDGNGTVDSTDVVIDYDQAFPTVDIGSATSRVMLK